MHRRNPVGKTQNQGWEIGVRRTMPMRAARTWRLLTTPPGLCLWLGEVAAFPLKKGSAFETKERIVGTIVGFKSGALLRMRWQPESLIESSTLQLRVLPSGEKAVVSIHHERLANARQRQRMRKHRVQALDRIQAHCRSAT